MAFRSIPMQSIPSRTACLGLLTILLACQPLDERPGTWLSGQRTAKGVTDWSFTSAIDEIFIETKPWYGIPHSTTIWCVDLDGQLYVGSYGEEKKAWEEAIAQEPDARVSIEGQIYDVTLFPVNDPELDDALTDRYHEKYDMEGVFEVETREQVPDWWYYRVEQAKPARA